MYNEETILTDVKVEKTIQGDFHLEKVWRILSDFEGYSQIMNNVKSVKVFEDNGKHSEWHIDVEGAPITWTEKDSFDEPNYTISFNAIKGDFKVFKGNWILKKEDNKLTIYFDVKYSLGLVQLEKVMGHILKEKMISNIEQMLDSILGEISKV